MSTHEVVELDKLLAALKKSAAALRDAARNVNDADFPGASPSLGFGLAAPAKASPVVPAPWTTAQEW